MIRPYARLSAASGLRPAALRPGRNPSRDPKSLSEIDAVAGDLAEAARASGRSVVVLSEYGITRVDRPIHINRALRDAGLLAVREEDGGELLDPTVSKAFAVADHQIAHVYVSESGLQPKVREILQGLPGIERVYDAADKHNLDLDHPRAGELVAMADARSWFTYYYWTDDRRAPDFARTVEIHRKPGYDPVELFLDPKFHRRNWRSASVSCFASSGSGR